MRSIEFIELIRQIDHMVIPAKDMQASTIEQVIQFLTFIENLSHKPAPVPCLVGQGRSGTFVAVYRLAAGAYWITT